MFRVSFIAVESRELVSLFPEEHAINARIKRSVNRIFILLIDMRKIAIIVFSLPARQSD